MAILLIFWLLCGVVCYFIMKSKGYPNSTCLAHGVGGALLAIIWIIVVLCKKDYAGTKSTSQLSDIELLSKLMDLKDRGAITEAEFLAKKREILNNVKRNNNSVKQVNNQSAIQTQTLRMTTAFLFFIVCFICVIGGLLYESDFLPFGFSEISLSYDNFLDYVYRSFGSMAIVSAIIVVLLMAKVDMRFLSIPIIVISLNWLIPCYYILIDISNFKNFTLPTYLCAFCAISTIILLFLIFFSGEEGKHSMILYIIPGISRVIYAICWFIASNKSPLNVEESYFVFSMLDFLSQFFILPIAFIFLGLLIQRLSVKKTKSKATIR